MTDPTPIPSPAADRVSARVSSDEDRAAAQAVAKTAGELERTNAALRNLFDTEAKIIDARRAIAFEPDSPELTHPQAGLALSGGGVRSATFCLGLIQGLAANGLLRRFDYLSTVSGGGYVGASVGRLINRWGIDEAERLLASGDSQILGWLRKNGRYLTPSGARDLGMAIATLMRSSLSTHFELGITAMLLGLLVVLPHAVQTQFNLFDVSAWNQWKSAWWPFAVGWWWLAAPGSIWCFWSLRDPMNGADDSPRRRERLIDTALAMAAVALSGWYAVQGYAPHPGWIPGFSISRIGALIALGALGGMLYVNGVFWRRRRKAGNAAAPSASTAGSAAATVESLVNGLRNSLTRWLRVVNSITAGLFVLGLLDWLSFALADKFQEGSLFGWLPGVAGVVGVLVLALRNASESLQKKMASSGSDRVIGLSQLVNLAGWFAGGVLLFSWVVCLNWLVLLDDPANAAFHGIAPVWAMATIFGLMLIWFGATRKHKEAVNSSTLHGFYRARLIRAYLSVGNILRFPQMLKPARGDIEARTRSVVDVVDGDDLPLTDYRPQDAGGPIHLVGVTLNQTVDDHGDLYNADRKGSAVTVSAQGVEVGPTEAGLWQSPDSSASLGQWITISGAAASPGAGSNTTRGWALLLYIFGVRLGYWTQSLVSTVGRIPGSKSILTRWKLKLQATKPGLMVSEALGSFAGRQFPWWYLSDGGHFENTAVYALLKREVAFIVLADCGADPQYLMEDLENLVRKARIDFDAEIELYTAQEALAQFGPFDPELRVLSPEQVVDNHTQRGILLARICYHSSRDAAERTFGTLVIVKPNLHQSLDTDVLAYARRNPSFPQQSTADQFFDESQWESYRRLGQDFGNALTAQRLAQFPGWTTLVPADNQVVPLRRQPKKFQQPVVTEPFWRRGAGAAAIGTTLSVGVLTSVLGVAWTIYDGVIKERQEHQTQVSATVADANTDFKVLTPKICAVKVPNAIALCGNTVPSQSDLDDLDAKSLQKLYVLAGKPDYKGSLDGLSASLDHIRQACGMPSTTCLVPMPAAAGLCNAVCERLSLTPDYEPYWALTTKNSKLEDNLILGPMGAALGAWILPPLQSVSVPPAPPIAPTELPKAVQNTEMRVEPTTTMQAQTMVKDAQTKPAPVLTADLSTCRSKDGAIGLYVQIFDEQSRPLSDAIKRLFTDDKLVIIAPVENVTRTALARGSKVPSVWKTAAILVHLPADRVCAEGVAKDIRDSQAAGVNMSIEVRDLPASFKSTRHVLELWLPPFVEKAE